MSFGVKSQVKGTPTENVARIILQNMYEKSIGQRGVGRWVGRNSNQAKDK